MDIEPDNIFALKLMHKQGIILIVETGRSIVGLPKAPCVDIEGMIYLKK